MVSIIILNHKMSDSCIELIQSVLETDPLLPLEFIVVDNFSQDGSVDKIKRHLPFVQIIRNTENLGRAAAMNQAIDLAEGNKILFVDPRIKLHEPKTLTKAIAYLDRSSEKTIVGLKIVDSTGSEYVNTYNGFPSLGMTVQYSYLYRPGVKKTKKQRNSGEVTWMTNEFLLMRADELRNTKERMDPSYQYYGEEMDWAYRLTQAGMSYHQLNGIQVTISNYQKAVNDIFSTIQSNVDTWLFVRKQYGLAYCFLFFLSAHFFYWYGRMGSIGNNGVDSDISKEEMRGNLYRKLWAFCWRQYGFTILFSPQKFHSKPINKARLESMIFKILK